MVNKNYYSRKSYQSNCHCKIWFSDKNQSVFFFIAFKNLIFFSQILLKVLIVAWGTSLFGQSKVLSFNQLTVEDDLSSQTNNYYIFQDSRGFIWISSTEGVNRFNGQNIISFPPNTSKNNTLLDGDVTSNFFEDHNGSIWFSTFRALYRYDWNNGSFKRLFVYENGNRIQEGYQLLYFDSNANRLWVRVTNKLYHCTPFQDSLKQNFIDIVPDYYRCSMNQIKQKGDYFHFTPNDSGLEIRRYSNSGKISKNASFQFKNYIISGLFIDGNSNLWMGTDKGLLLCKLTPKGPIVSKLIDDKIKGINNIIPYESDKLIIATRNSGIFLFNKNSKLYISQINSNNKETISPFTKLIDGIYLDNDKNLWVSSSGNGVYFFNLEKAKFRTILPKKPEKSDEFNNVVSFTEDKKRNIWCLTSNGIVILDSLGNKLIGFEKYQNNNIPFSNIRLFQIYCDKHNRIWVCSQKGLFLLNQETDSFEQISPFNLEDSPLIIHIKELENCEKFVAASSSGMYEIVKKEKQFYLKSFEDFNREGAFTIVMEDIEEQEVFVFKDLKNLIALKQQANTLIPFDTIPVNARVNDIIKDKKNRNLLIGTTAGLFFLKKKKNHSYSIIKDTIWPNLPINAMLLDLHDNLWISSNRGLLKYNLSNRKYQFFNQIDGLQSLDFNYKSKLKTSTGKFIFGGVNGINIFNPYEVKNLQIKPNPTITYIEINNKPFPNYIKDSESNATNITEIKNIIFKYNQNDLILRMAALEYSDPSANEYSFILEKNHNGIVDKRKEVIFKRKGKNNEFQYPNMQPGKYVLKYNASNSDGVWFPELEKELHITINPPWWQTGWAYAGYILIITALLYAYYRFRITQIKKEETLKRQEAELRQKEAEYKQLAAETETAILRLQMNPHFIFNSMNSINSYILKRDVDTASNYLHRFASLMRMILDLAAKKLISVTEEVELLEMYMETEAMRFEQQFTYTFHMDNELDGDEFVLPPMILQPFVENAILHGVSGKKGGGHIDVRFWEGENYLGCSVEDNGIGRKAAAEQKNKFKAHESKALAITDKRLQFLEPIDGVIAKRTVADLYDENQNPSGTKVTLILPIL